MAKEIVEKSPVNEESPQAPPNESEAKITQKELVNQLKEQWKLLWSERFNDKVKAEDVSLNEYATLRVEQGTVIHATRDFKVLNFKEILEQNLVADPERFVQPDVTVGGWGKFVKTEITHRPTKLAERNLCLKFQKNR